MIYARKIQAATQSENCCIERSDGSIRYIRPFGLIQEDRQQWTAAHIKIDPAGFISYASDEG